MIKEAWQLLAEKLIGWGEGLVLLLPNFVVALLLMVVVIIVSRFMRNVVRRILNQFISNIPIINFITSVVNFALLLLGFVLILSVLELDKAVTSVLAGAGVVGLAIGLAFQNPIRNTVSGFIMSYRDFYRTGDWVETNGYYGFIEKIGIRVTHLHLTSGELVVLPNDIIVTNSFKNISINGSRAVVIKIGVSYGDDLEKVEEVVRTTIEQYVEHIESKIPEVYFQEYGDSSINFMVRFWIDQVAEKHYLKVKSDAIKAIKKAFDQNDITIPFPIRTLDFGIKGGQKLDEMLPDDKG
jgi:small conductance mechanosensitive channel